MIFWGKFFQQLLDEDDNCNEIYRKLSKQQAHQYNLFACNHVSYFKLSNVKKICHCQKYVVAMVR